MDGDTAPNEKAMPEIGVGRGMEMGPADVRAGQRTLKETLSSSQR